MQPRKQAMSTFLKKYKVVSDFFKSIFFFNSIVEQNSKKEGVFQLKV